MLVVIKFLIKIESCIKECGGDPTYGEIKHLSATVLLDALQLTSEDVFYDLGCGVGKLVMQVYLMSPAKRAVGIELSEARCGCARKVLKPISGKLYDTCMNCENEIRKLLGQEKLKKTTKKTIEFFEKDMLKADISDATVIFTCSTCFSDDLMNKLVKKFATLQDGLRVLTLKQLPEHPDFKFVRTFTLPMTWSKSTPVHMYVLDRTKVVDEASDVDDADDLGEDLDDPR